MTNQETITGLQIILKEQETILSSYNNSRYKYVGGTTGYLQDKISTLKAAIEKIRACESL